MSEANKRARIEYLQSLVGEYRAALESAADEIKMLRKAKQDAFDLGFRAAGGSIHPIVSNQPAGELVGWQPDIDVITGRRND